MADIFAYAHSNVVVAGLKAYIRSKKCFISDGYCYLDEPNEYTAFKEILEIPEKDGKDILYVDSVKEFAGNSLQEFKENLKAIYEADMVIKSLSEPDYNYYHFLSAIEVVESLSMGYRNRDKKIAAIGMYLANAEIGQIASQLDMNESEV